MVYLNQTLVVYFTEGVEPLSITSDTVRIVDADNHSVPVRRLEVGPSLVRVHPHPPVQQTLDDGTFVPGGTYWLEVAGYPHVNAVRSKRGHILERGMRVKLSIVPREGTPEYSRPLLPEGVGNEPFTLDPTRRLELQSGATALALHFTLPPFPPSVRPEAFTVRRYAATTQRIERVHVAAARVARDPGDPVVGCTVELLLRPDPPIAPTDHVALSFEGGESGLVDYKGRAVAFGTGVGGVLHVHVRAGAQLELGRVMAAEVAALEGVGVPTPGFEIRDRARFVPRVRIAAGSGVHGLLRPTESTRLGPSEAFALSGGRILRADATLELTGIDIPRGVRLTLGGFPGPVRILVTGSVRIAGELALETPRGPVSELDDSLANRLMPIREDSLDTLAGCVIVAAGDIEVSGRIEHVQEREPMGPALALVAGGGLALRGRTPPGTVCACEGEFSGDMQAARFRPVRLRSGYVGLVPVVASGCTRWVPLPDWIRSGVQGTAVDADPGVDVAWQLAPPDPIDPMRPDLRPEVWSQPRPISEPILTGAGQFVRFVVRARIEPGSVKLPGIAGITWTAR